MNLGIIELDWSALMILVNILILYIVMKKFFFEKIHNFMQARQDSVRDAIATAEDVNRKADQKMADYQRRIARVEEEGKDIIRESKIKADEQAKKIIDDANQRAANILSRAEEEVEREKIKAAADMKTEVTGLALLAASRIMEQELEGTEKQQELVDRVIREAGGSAWQS